MPGRRSHPVLIVGVYLLVSTTMLPAAPASIRAVQTAASVEPFFFVEVSLRVERPDASNPFTDVSVTGEFTRAGSPPVGVVGFCDAADGSVYRVRFMPSKPGRYRYWVLLQQGNFSFRHEGRFRVTEGIGPGPVRVDPEHPFSFHPRGDWRALVLECHDDLSAPGLG